MTGASLSFAGNLTDDPELRHTEAGITRAVFRVAVNGRRDQEPSCFTVIVAGPGRARRRVPVEGQPGGGRGRLQQRSWTAEDAGARSTVEVVAEELGGEPSVGDGESCHGQRARRRA